ncbi:MAG: hypothetical protein WD070_04645, partial [Pirellulaceae bacterium]
MMILILSAAGIVDAQETAQLSDRIVAHTEARELANDIVTSIFNVQLRHLEENGLTGLPLYAEIRASRDKIDRLSSTEMEQLSQLLQELQSG